MVDKNTAVICYQGTKELKNCEKHYLNNQISKSLVFDKFQNQDLSDLNDRDFEFEMEKSKKDQNSKLVIELDYMVEQSEESKSMSDTYVI